MELFLVLKILFVICIIIALYAVIRNLDIIKIISMSNLLKLSIITTEKDHVKIPKNLRKKIFSIPFEIVFNESEFFKNLKLKINLND